MNGYRKSEGMRYDFTGVDERNYYETLNDENVDNAGCASTCNDELGNTCLGYFFETWDTYNDGTGSTCYIFNKGDDPSSLKMVEDSDFDTYMRCSSGNTQFFFSLSSQSKSGSFGHVSLGFLNLQK